jgi:hypothetical protein
MDELNKSYWNYCIYINELKNNFAQTHITTQSPTNKVLNLYIYIIEIRNNFVQSYITTVYSQVSRLKPKSLEVSKPKGFNLIT